MVNEPIIPTADLLPKRQPNLIERVFRAMVKADPTMGPQPAQQMSTQSGVLPQMLQQMFGQYFTSPHDRIAIYKDLEEMDAVAEEYSTALDVMTNNTTTSEDGVQMSYDIECDDAAAKKILDDTTTNADLHKMVKPLSRAALKYGDSFNEVLVNGEWNVVGIRILPPATMFRNQDASGNLLLGKPQYDLSTNKCLNQMRECAYEQRSEDNRTIVATFRPWQIAHTRMNWDGYDPYGHAPGRVTRIIWKKLHALDEALIIGRLTRAFLKLVFKIDTTGLAAKDKEVAITKFRESIIARQKMDGKRENPFSVMTDIFMATGYVRGPGMQEWQPSQSAVEVLDPKNAQLTDIDDIKYLYRKYLVTLRVPPAHLGIEEDVNAKATLGWQDVNYIRFIRDVQSTIGQTLEQIYDTALVLKGYDPKTVEYKIKWPRLSATDEAADALAESNRATADTAYAALGAIDAQWIQEHRFDMTEEEIEEISGRVQKAKQDDLKQQADMQEQQAQNNHGRQLELVKANAEAKGPQDGKPPGANGNGNGKGTIRQALDSLTQYPVVNREKGALAYQDSKSVRLLAEAIKSRTSENLNIDLERLLKEQSTALAEARQIVKDIKEPVLPLDRPAAPAIGHLDVHAHINAEVKPADVHPTPIHVDAPHVELKTDVNVPAPQLGITNEVKLPEQKPPVVNVKASAKPADVTIKNEITTPAPKVDVNVQPADVTVIKESAPETDVEITRDDRGNVTGAKRVPKKER